MDERNFKEMKSIPDELLGIIFTMIDYQPYHRFKQSKRDSNQFKGSIVTPDVWRCRSPMSVCHVSHGWRRAALNTPKIWSDLVVDVKKAHVLDMMGHWFERAKAVPIDVTLWCEKGRRLDHLGRQAKDIERSVGYIKQHLHQVLSLRMVTENETNAIFDDDDDITTFCQSMGRVGGTCARSLRSLTVCSMYTDIDRVDSSCLLPNFSFDALGDISTLDIRGFFVSKPFLGNVPASLTTLKLDAPILAHQSAQYADILEVLSNLPHLQQLRLRGNYPMAYNARIGLSKRGVGQTIPLLYLTKLTLMCYSCATYIQFLYAPALQHFKLKERNHILAPYLRITPNTWDGIGSVVSSFLARSRAPLVRFSAIDIGRDLRAEELTSWLHQMDTLEVLALSQSRDILEAVISTLESKSGGHEGLCCPNLKILKYRWWGQSVHEEGKGLNGITVRDGVVINCYMDSDPEWVQLYGVGGKFGHCLKLQ